MAENKKETSVVNPRFIIENGFVSNLIDPEVQVQPNGIDLTVQIIRSVPIGLAIDFSNENRFVPEGTILFDSDKIDDDKAFILNDTEYPLKQYLVQYRELIKIPPTMSAIVIPRSSLMRGGAFIQSSWYDSGYEGHGTVILFAPQQMKIYPRARIGQIIYFTSEPAFLYKGKYQHENTGNNDEESSLTRDVENPSRECYGHYKQWSNSCLHCNPKTREKCILDAKKIFEGMENARKKQRNINFSDPPADFDPGNHEKRKES